MLLAVCCITKAISTEYSAAGDATTGTAAGDAGLLQVELRLFRIERSLRQAGEIEAVGRVDRLIVGDHCLVERDRLLHLLAVEQVLHRQNEIRVRARCHVLAHDRDRSTGPTGS